MKFARPSGKTVSIESVIHTLRGEKVILDALLTGMSRANATFQEPIKNPARFPWHEVKKIDHYYLSVDALTRPIQVREDSPPYGGHT